MYKIEIIGKISANMNPDIYRAHKKVWNMFLCRNPNEPSS